MTIELFNRLPLPRGAVFVLEHAMPAPCHPAIVERTQVLVETTLLPTADIARQGDISPKTVREWTKKHGWRRPPGAQGEPKLPPEKHGPAQRVFENRASAIDLAILIGCSKTYIYQYARRHQWKRNAGGAAIEPPNEEIAAIVAALCEPGIERREALRHMERAIALTAADALAGGEARHGRQADMLGKLVGFAKSLPEDVAAPRRDADATDTADHFPDANDLIEEIARRVEAYGNEWLDPRILALVAETIP